MRFLNRLGLALSEGSSGSSTRRLAIPEDIDACETYHLSFEAHRGILNPVLTVPSYGTRLYSCSERQLDRYNAFETTTIGLKRFLST